MYRMQCNTSWHHVCTGEQPRTTINGGGASGTPVLGLLTLHPTCLTLALVHAVGRLSVLMVVAFFSLSFC